MIFLVVAASYLIGSVSFAVVISKISGLPDPRTYGSGNPGATNVLRTGRKSIALLTLLGDGAKGWFAVFLAEKLFALPPVTSSDGYTLAAVGLAVFLGHLFPVFHRFQGGKGVATMWGVLFGFSPWLALASFLTWLIILVFFRYSSFAAIIAAVFAPFYACLLFGVNWMLLAIVVMSLLLILRHRANIQNLLAGKESRVFGKSKAA
jgi:acyl phosphate:glycerol-3-phosphate acyltransferase